MSTTINRRDALGRVALLLGGTIIGAEMFLSGCKNSSSDIGSAGLNFTQDDLSFLDEVGETILPKTNTPGAKDVKIGEFMKTIVNDCYGPKDQQVFVAGIKKLDEASIKKSGKSFLASTPQQRHDLLVDLDKEAKDYGKSKKPEDPPHYFRMIKELTLWGYFTSKPGATEALRYVAVPGRFEGCVDYKKGDKAWATS